MTKIIKTISLSFSLLAFSLSHNAVAENPHAQHAETSQPTTTEVQAPAAAQAAPANPAPQEPSKNPAQQLAEGIQALSDFINSADKVDDSKLALLFDEQLATLFDFDEMGRLIAGDSYYTMDAQAQKQFQDRLKGWFLYDLSKQLLSLSREKPKIEFFRPHDDEPGSVLARASITQFHKDKSISNRSQLSFKFMRGQLGWKILDISANGDSAILYYRDIYRTQIQQARQAQYRQQMKAQAKAMQAKQAEAAAAPKTEAEAPKPEAAAK